MTTTPKARCTGSIRCGSNSIATAATGCHEDLFPWVEATVGAGSNGMPPPADFTYKEGATSMGFYNVQQGDAPYLK